jgi:uncharacterized membrane-anchored protein
MIRSRAPAYVMTRPFGASVADWVGVPPARGGIGIGTGVVSLVALLVIVGVVLSFEIAARRPVGPPWPAA